MSFQVDASGLDPNLSVVFPLSSTLGLSPPTLQGPPPTVPGGPLVAPLATAALLGAGWLALRSPRLPYPRDRRTTFSSSS